MRKSVLTILSCHFISAFAALGMPPFFAIIFSKSFHSQDSASFAGVIYVLPVFFAAISGPFWGSLADRFGKKHLLIRAQLGLAISFLLAGYAPNPFMFALALALQGILGGTFAASRAYLATLIHGRDLRNSLNWMEGSPRLALVIAPVVFGFFMNLDSPLVIYKYLATLPLFAAYLIYKLPESGAKTQEQTKPRSPNLFYRKLESRFVQVLALQFILGFSAVIISPHFVPAVQKKFIELSPSQIGLLFGIPHLVYLLISGVLSRTKLISQATSNLTFQIGLVLASQALFTFVQADSQNLLVFCVARILSGISMTAAFILLHEMISDCVTHGYQGRQFGWLESASKISVVAGGIASDAAVRLWGSNIVFELSALTLFFFVFALSIFNIRQITGSEA